MNNSTNPPPPRPRKSPWRWLKWCCLTLLLAILTVAAVGWLFFQQQRRQWTDEQPMAIAAPAADGLRRAEAERLYRDTRQALERGQKTQLSFDSQQLNAVLSQAPEFQNLQQKLSLQLQGDKLLTRMSLPLDEVPGFQGRYLNGDFVFSLQVDQGTPAIKLLSGNVHGQPIPDRFLQQLNQIGQQQLVQRLGSRVDLSQVESLRLENSQLILKLRGKQP
ncbi:MAG: hypothetical protein GX564_07790 [Oligosphaeraceae bacterium]|nr:hypothetical protein [Oligosphaeraceae bacterium]